MLKKPISVVLACYNGEEYISEQLISIENQKKVDISELIIVDDNSKDNSILEIENFISQSSLKVKLFKNSKNIGVNKSFEKGILNVTNDLIALCDQDDIWDELKIYYLQHTLHKNNLEIVFNKSYINQSRAVYNEKRIDESDSLWFNKFRGASSLFTNSFIKSIIPFSDAGLYDKWIYYACIIGRRNYLVYETPLDYHRIHDNNFIKKNSLFDFKKKHHDFIKRVFFFKELNERLIINNNNFKNKILLDFYNSCYSNNLRNITLIYLTTILSFKLGLIEKRLITRDFLLYISYGFKNKINIKL